MMATKRMVMVAMKIVKSKKDGIVKVLLLKEQVFVSISSLTDLTSLLLDQSMPLGRLFKVLDYLTFLLNLQQMIA